MMITVRELLAKGNYAHVTINEPATRHTDQNLFCGEKVTNESLLNRVVGYSYENRIYHNGKSALGLFISVTV